jgi:hypothetical protein
MLTVPLTGCVACQNVPVTGVDGIEAIETGTAAARSWASVSGPLTGCVACQKVPLTGSGLPELTSLAVPSVPNVTFTRWY